MFICILLTNTTAMENEHPAYVQGQGWRYETEHSMLRRMQGHDYQSRCIYMITICTEGRAPILGTLHYVPGQEDKAYVAPTPLGLAVQQCWADIPKFHPEVGCLAFQLMPDHIHGILFVHKDSAQHLGHIINGFKVGCNRAVVPFSEALSVGCSEALPVGCSEALPPNTKLSKHPTHGKLFAIGYQDSILRGKDQLIHMFRYLADNPRRLAMKRQHRQWFTVQRNVSIAGTQCQLYGNAELLNNPNKMAVIVHRRYTDTENAQLCDTWLECGAKGGVLVSAAISPKEHQILKEAMESGYNIILLLENGFPELYKPIGQYFDACAAGHLLQISPWGHHVKHKIISRQQCLTLNALAEKIASSTSDGCGITT